MASHRCRCSLRQRFGGVLNPGSGGDPFSIKPVFSITTMAEPNHGSTNGPEPVGADELNAWKRGFTPQAEIWNGRLAMIGLSAGLAVVLLVRVFAGG